MNLASGQTYLAIPGPSVIPEAVLRAMHRASPNIYEGELVDLTHTLVPDLRYVAQTAGNVALYIANGHGAWEAALANMACHGDRVLVAATGWFAHGWAKMARAMGIHADIVEYGSNSAIHLGELEEAIKKHPRDYYKAVLVTHVDTSSSVKNEIAPIRQLMDDLSSDALLAVDCVASLGCDTFKMDKWGADVMVAACQKGLMVPAGMAFVYFNDKAAEKQKGLPYVSSYWEWDQRAHPEILAHYFCGTAPTHHLYGLRVALDMIKDEGIENIWMRHDTLARAIWAAVDQWGQGGAMRMNIHDPDIRSSAVTALHLGAPDAKNLRMWTQTKAGLTLGIGLGMSTPSDPNGDGFFRFGHMGHVNAQMIMGMLSTVQTGLMALDIPHGSGAIEAAASVLAEA